MDESSAVYIQMTGCCICGYELSVKGVQFHDYFLQKNYGA
jgi:hypothetical protein